MISWWALPTLLCALAALIQFAVPARGEAPAPRKHNPIKALENWLQLSRPARPELRAQPFAKVPLTKAESEEAQRLLWDEHVAEIHATREKEWNDKAITVADHTLRFKDRHFGTKPKEGWNLYISMHGGGGAPAQVNDQQWENQIRLYQPKDALVIAPRAPTNTWNLWHESHIDVLFNRLLEDAFVLGEVDPNHVYLLGYSAGGDGVYQLAPRMADRWAAAAMMAGHPNDASPLGLRNIGFTIHVGALDNGYNRNKVAAEWGKKLDELQKADPQGYAHETKLHAGRGHWMNLEDKEALDWMAKFTRTPLPTKVVWKQASTTHDRFYWLAMPQDQAAGGQLVIARRDGQTIEIEKSAAVKSLTILLNDAMLDLDKPVAIRAAGRQLFSGTVERTIANLEATLAGRGDPDEIFPSRITVSLQSP